MGLIRIVLDVFSWLIIIRIFTSLLGYTSRQNKWVKLIYKLTDPIVIPLQRILPTVPIGNIRLDFAPLVALLLLDVIEYLLNRIVNII